MGAVRGAGRTEAPSFLDSPSVMATYSDCYCLMRMSEVLYLVVLSRISVPRQHRQDELWPSWSMISVFLKHHHLACRPLHVEDASFVTTPKPSTNTELTTRAHTRLVPTSTRFPPFGGAYRIHSAAD